MAKQEIKLKDSLVYRLRTDSTSLLNSLKYLDNKNFELSEENKRLKLLIEEHGKVQTRDELFSTVPVVPVPPPQPTDYLILQLNSIKKLKNYSQVDSVISKAFQPINEKRTYLAVENGGFAVTTDIEEIDQNGNPLNKDSQQPPPSILDFFKKRVNGIFFSKTGFYRCVIIIVSPNLYQLGGTKISYNELNIWLNSKTIKLPDEIGRSAISGPLQVVALLYEFEQNENVDKKNQIIEGSRSKTKLKNYAIIKSLSNGN